MDIPFIVFGSGDKNDLVQCRVPCTRLTEFQGRLLAARTRVVTRRTGAINNHLKIEIKAKVKVPSLAIRSG